MKRFILFVCENYYPHGGWEDFFDSYVTQDEARAAGKARCLEEMRTYHVVDTQTWEIVCSTEADKEC